MGMFTSDAYAQDVEKIPLISNKVQRLVAMHKLRSRYMIRKLKHLIKSYPLEELMQADIHHLSQNFDRILRSDEREIAEVDVRQDISESFYSIMVYAPKDVFKTALRQQIQDCLVSSCQGTLLHYSPYFTDSSLVRMHYVISAGQQIEDIQKLKMRIKELCIPWERGLTSFVHIVRA